MRFAAGHGATAPSLPGLLSALFLMTGCAGLPPHTLAPHSSLPDAATLGLDPRAQSAIDQAWWKGFGDPQLDRLIDTATANSPTLALAMTRIKAAEADLSLERAEGMPMASLSAEAQRQRLSGHYIIPPPFAGTTQTFGDITGTVSVNLDLWGKRKATIARAGKLAEAQALDAAGARLAIIVAVVQAYVDLERAYRSEALAVRVTDQRQGLLGLIDNRVDSGLESTVEQSLAQARLVDAQIALAAARADREIALHTLAALSGKGPAFTQALQPPKLNIATRFDLPDFLPADLIGRRPDIQAARVRIEAATSGRAAARADFFPNVNLTAFAGFASFGLSDLVSSTSRTYGAGPALSLPLFDAGALKARYVHASAEVDAAVADYDMTVLTAVRQVADRISRIRAAQSELTMQQQRLAASHRAYDGTMTRYRSGLTNLLAVREADSLLIDAERGELMLEIERLSQNVGLILALGGGFTPPPAADHGTPPARTE